MAETDPLNRNLLALASRDPHLAARISNTKPDESIQFVTSKSSHLVPAQSDGKRIAPYHSRFDPIREGERYLGADSGFLVVLGLAGGHHLRPILEQSQVSNILVIEKNIAMVRAVFETIDLTDLLSDPRVNILVDASFPAIAQRVLDLYLPTLSGDLSTISLQSRVNLEPRYFQDALRAVRTSIDRIADDLTVQSRFGVKWFHNTLANLAKADETPRILGPIKRAIVTGAGPSLEDQIPQLKKAKANTCLIATDTSLPCLTAHDIIPDLVLSIDCQQVSYHHFLSGLPAHTSLVLDLASPPVLTRLTDRLIFFSSGHPFSQYLSQTWRSFPTIDTSGGNVSHAALSLAARMGAREIQLLGVDFSYPEGKSYARGTYLYPYYRSSENRFQPLENSSFSFLLRGANIIREKTGGFFRYTTNSMLAYKERMEIAIGEIGVRVTAPPGRGLPLEIKRTKPLRSTSAGFRFPQPEFLQPESESHESWRDYAASLVRKLKSLPAPTAPLSSYWHSLSTDERRLWIIQIPASVAFKERRKQESLTAPQLLSDTRDWSVGMLERSIGY